MMEMNRDTATAADPLLEHRAFVTGLARALFGRDPRVENVRKAVKHKQHRESFSYEPPAARRKPINGK